MNCELNHDKKFFVSSSDGTHWCAMCELVVTTKRLAEVEAAMREMVLESNGKVFYRTDKGMPMEIPSAIAKVIKKVFAK